MNTFTHFRHYVVYCNRHPDLLPEFDVSEIFATYRDVERFCVYCKKNGYTVTRVIRVTMEEVTRD